MTVRCGDIHGMTALPVILTMLLVRIWSFGFYKACTREMGQTCEKREEERGRERRERRETPSRERSECLYHVLSRFVLSENGSSLLDGQLRTAITAYSGF